MWVPLFTACAGALSIQAEMVRRKSILVEETPNALREITLARGRRLNAVDAPMLEALFESLRHPAVLLSSLDSRAFCAGGDVRALTSEVVDFLWREAQTLARLEEREVSIAISSGVTMGFGAGLFVASRERVVTEGTVFAMPECRIGLCPDAGSLSFLRRLPRPIGLWVALTGARLTASDCLGLGLATRFVRRNSDDYAALREELRYAPLDELEVVLSRRCGVPPRDLASPLCSSEAVLAALERVAEAEDAAGVLANVEVERHRASTLVGSVSWQTRERAEAVFEVLDAGRDAMRASCPLALETTFAALSTLDANDPGRARLAEIVINANLATRPHFAHRVASLLGGGGGENSAISPPPPPLEEDDVKPRALALVARAQRALDALDSGMTTTDIKRTYLTSSSSSSSSS
ncbi:hypothetical protein CTAYLR_003537 [Chrysophaeum taylorii]|uniref:3-hydroxyisobutyryl-CoA hydrolase n=1 Tax=Chrysophaeum taylorii TaxID=2483200 RepID=A0AAD7UCD6_9STRA|nr:hypothetical protein CTAYLR_003537 [Chrysophaeum taylorii]